MAPPPMHAAPLGHTALPFAVANVPGATAGVRALQKLTPAAPENAADVCSGHGEHAVAPASLYVLAEQMTGAALPPAHVNPATHGTPTSVAVPRGQ